MFSPVTEDAECSAYTANKEIPCDVEIYLYSEISLSGKNVIRNRQIDDINKGIVILDSNWISKNANGEAYKSIGSLIERKVPVIYLSDNPDLFVENVGVKSHSFSPGSTMYGHYSDSERNLVCCYEVECRDEGDAILLGSNWAIDVIADSKERTTGIPYGSEMQTFHDKECDSYGWLNVRTIYYAIEEDNDRYNYYVSRYNIQVVPNRGNHCRNGDIFLNCDLRQDYDIISYGPTTTSGSSSPGESVSVSISGTVLPNPGAGAGFAYSESWSYAIPDVVVYDNSNYALRKLDIRPDIDQEKAVGMNTYVCYPGKVATKDCLGTFKPGSYVGTDNYGVLFCKYWTLFGNEYWLENKEFNIEKLVCFHGLPHSINFLGNGETGNMFDDESGLVHDPTYTYSRGSEITFTDEGYYKTGYRMIGYSESPTSAVAEYPLGSKMVVKADKNLFAVWVAD